MKKNETIAIITNNPAFMISVGFMRRNRLGNERFSIAFSINSKNACIEQITNVDINIYLNIISDKRNVAVGFLLYLFNFLSIQKLYALI